MFLSARWRNEKNKIKVVFKLQFHATPQVGIMGLDPLTLSGIPEDVGKPTMTLEKGLVRDGSCYWENPIYETVKFTQDQKTGKINEKIYRFVISKGSSKAGVIGEFSIDFAKYAMASTKVSSLSLPLRSTKSGTVLHVKIQRVLESDTLRDVNDSDEHARVRFNRKSLKTQFNMDEAENNIKAKLIEDKTIEQVDILSSGVNSSLDTHREYQVKIDNVIQEERQVSQWEWLRGSSAPETSTDDSSNSPREIVSVETSQETIIEKLKVELADLSRQASIYELELQSLRKQVIKECKKGQDISKEMDLLKEERDELKKELTQYKSFRERLDQLKARDRLNFVEGDPWNMLGQLREELQYERNLNTNLKLQLQKTQDSNSELILAVQELEDSLQHTNHSSENLTVVTVKDLKENESSSVMNIDDDDEEQRALEKLVMKDQVDCNEDTELQIFRKDKDELEMQIEQLELDYEILKQENHDLSYKLEQNELQEQLKVQYECSSYSVVTELETELKKQSEQLSNYLAITTKHEIHIQNLEEEIEKRAKIFEADLEIISLSKIEQEKRAIKAEEALRKMKMQNASTAERLQEEFKRLSRQMTFTFDENEKLTVKALAEASELRVQKTHLEEILWNARDDYEEKMDELRRVAERLEREKKSLIEEIRHKGDNFDALLAKCSISVDELEKEKLQKQIVQLKSQSASLIGIPKEIDNLKQKMKLFQEQIKLKEIAIETSVNLFLGKEKDLLYKIEELERQLEEELKQTGITICAHQLQKVYVDTMCATEEGESQKSNQSIRRSRKLKENEKNMAIEEELKEMQGRYYEISVRLAEVEGERQKLMMTVRSLKNLNKKT
ncbi:myosin-2-like [Impatiens glandulifera]|uniref:myosin-2-like n=1 Tax=Impatiens glandulifera TaxID=253017 RepID=UPI001FB06DE3|nr:myosin-2-like [Impatiens glandulifera]